MCSSLLSQIFNHQHSVYGYVKKNGDHGCRIDHIQKNTCTMSAADAEMCTYFNKSQHTVRKKLFLQQIGLLLKKPTPLFLHLKHHMRRTHKSLQITNSEYVPG